MNCVIRVCERIQESPKRMALWTEKHGILTFAEMHEIMVKSQSMFREHGVKPGDTVLMAALPGPNLFSAMCAVLGLGATVLFVEPWLPIQRIEHVVAQMKPKVFFTGFLGKLWGMRVPGIRAIPHWLTEKDIFHYPSGEFHVESMTASDPAFIAFSSGTTGKPKGSLRTQGYMWDMHEILTNAHHIPEAARDRPDLAVFPNVALYQMGTGRGSVLVPSKWSNSSLAKIAELPESLSPSTVSCGPAFLKKLLTVPGFESLSDFHVGGALTDCWIFEEAFVRWPKAKFTHIYGGSEAEPVALQDAREAVRLSQERGYFQTLSLGKPFPVIQFKLEPDTVWVAGPNVSPEYIGDPIHNVGVKVRDENGVLWHAMGDRIMSDADAWWYAGRQFQRPEDFVLEQKIYSQLQNSAAFLTRFHDGTLHLFGEKVKDNASALKKLFPQISEIHSTKIVRDRRHRARVDRTASLPKSFRNMGKK